MSFKEFPLTVREKSTYERIQSELDAMAELVTSKVVTVADMPGFMERYGFAIRAREQLIETIAVDRCLLPCRIVSVFEGSVVYR
jgi:hypothetical protein